MTLLGVFALLLTTIVKDGLHRTLCIKNMSEENKKNAVDNLDAEQTVLKQGDSFTAATIKFFVLNDGKCYKTKQYCVHVLPVQTIIW